ncbi:hypothetical protein ACFV4M_33255 [Kitasatospora indigofera]|uniref:hypothetical protein n=1 Tax=Kitasatospora indigofera TaxID=67307 RepID=UPI00364E7775
MAPAATAVVQVPAPGQVRVKVVAVAVLLTTVSWIRPAVQSWLTTADWPGAVAAAVAAWTVTAEAARARARTPVAERVLGLAKARSLPGDGVGV